MNTLHITHSYIHTVWATHLQQRITSLSPLFKSTSEILDRLFSQLLSLASSLGRFESSSVDGATWVLAPEFQPTAEEKEEEKEEEKTNSKLESGRGGGAPGGTNTNSSLNSNSGSSSRPRTNTRGSSTTSTGGVIVPRQQEQQLPSPFSRHFQPQPPRSDSITNSTTSNPKSRATDTSRHYRNSSSSGSNSNHTSHDHYHGRNRGSKRDTRRADNNDASHTGRSSRFPTPDGLDTYDLSKVTAYQGFEFRPISLVAGSVVVIRHRLVAAQHLPAVDVAGRFSGRSSNGADGRGKTKASSHRNRSRNGNVNVNVNGSDATSNNTRTGWNTSNGKVSSSNNNSNDNGDNGDDDDDGREYKSPNDKVRTSTSTRTRTRINPVTVNRSDRWFKLLDCCVTTEGELEWRFKTERGRRTGKGKVVIIDVRVGTGDEEEAEDTEAEAEADEERENGKRLEGLDDVDNNDEDDTGHGMKWQESTKYYYQII